MNNNKEHQTAFQKIRHNHNTTNIFQSLRYDWRKIWNPSWFQGSNAKNQYFEGWYYKNVSRNGMHRWSFIPGISLVNTDAHAFIQVIEGSTGTSYYFRFPLEQFLYATNSFAIKIGKNYFDRMGFSIDLSKDDIHFKGSLSFSEVSGYKARFSRPGIMGWYRYVPFMECYHGVVSLDHKIKGQIEHNGKQMLFDEGRGYIEKDWGSSMPKAWIWMQTNNFENSSGTSFMLSVARIPWIRNTFTGFLGFFHHAGKTITFATYTGAKIRKIEVSGANVHISIEYEKYRIDIEGHSEHAGALKAPVLGEMDRVIHESINAAINVRVTYDDGSLLFEGSGKHAGMEMVGNLDLLK